jgi:hypothetical protein
LIGAKSHSTPAARLSDCAASSRNAQCVRHARLLTLWPKVLERGAVSHLEALPSQKCRENYWGRCASRINEIDRLCWADFAFDQVLLTPDHARFPKPDLNH